MKKILFVSNFFGNGGAARVMNIISNSLSKSKDYQITIVSFIEFDNKYTFPQNTIHFTLKSKNKISRIIELRKIIKKGKYDVIISFEYFINMYTIIANMFLKNRLIISERNDPSRSGNSKKNIRNFLYKFCDCLVCQTEDAKNYFPQNIKNKTVIIPNPISDNLPVAYLGKRIKKIVTFCRINKQKNIYMMLDAFKIVLEKKPDYILEIYGDGSEKEKLIDYSKNLKIDNNVFFYGFTQNLHKKIINYSMYISTSDFEGISNSMLEALAIGLPTVCTDCPCGGARMAITDGINGLLSPVGDAKSFAEKMLLLLNDEEMMEKLSKNNFMVKEKFSSTKIVDEWKKVIG